MTNFIWITTQKELLHNYPDAPDAVSYLKNLHRHIFHFKIYLEIFTEDRDIEFIMFKKDVESMLNMFENLEHRSCETFSKYLVSAIRNIYPNRYIKIETSEDGENGVLMDFPTNKKIR